MRGKYILFAVVGLDNSGKSTLLNHFKAEDQQNANIGEIQPSQSIE
jgi:GTPase Era involved in 16S rRNA processing